jgi:hypothetical protein
MACKFAPRWLRISVAVASWAIAVSVVQVAVGVEIGRETHELEQRIELQLLGPRPPDPGKPEKSHENSIEPWELVGA